MAANIRFATEADIPVILEFIHALAAYENMEDQVIVTPELLKEWVFQKKKAEVFLVSEDEKPVGFALFFHQLVDAVGQKPRLLRYDAFDVAHTLTAFSLLYYILFPLYTALNGDIQIPMSLLEPAGFHVFSDGLYWSLRDFTSFRTV